MREMLSFHHDEHEAHMMAGLLHGCDGRDLTVQKLEYEPGSVGHIHVKSAGPARSLHCGELLDLRDVMGQPEPTDDAISDALDLFESEKRAEAKHGKPSQAPPSAKSHAAITPAPESSELEGDDVQL